MNTLETFKVFKVSFVLSPHLNMKDEILHTATELFLNQGFKSITMDDIAREMSISKKTIYTHYSNKEAIVEASADGLFTSICGGIDHICDLKNNPIEELYAIKKFVLEHLKGERTSPMYQLQKYYPKIHASLRKQQYDYMQNCMVDNIVRGVELGLFRENIDIQFVARIYFIGMTGIKDGDIFPSTQFPQPSLYDMYLEYHLRGIITPTGKELLNQLIQSNLTNDI
ncbi:MAG: AcrR family transcriptional regulator [Flavobacteriales bacterium]